MNQTSTGSILKNGSASSAPRIFPIENHDAALPIRKNLASKERIPVHLGQQSFQEWPWISAERPRLNDGHHFEIFLKLGNLHLAQGELDRATQFMDLAAGGFDEVLLRRQFTWLATRRSQWNRNAFEFGQACKQIAAQPMRVMGKLWRSVRGPFRRAFELWRVR